MGSNKAIEAGRETASEVQQRVNSIIFAKDALLGQTPSDNIKAFTVAGKNKTGKGKINLLKAV